MSSLKHEIVAVCPDFGRVVKIEEFEQMSKETEQIIMDHIKRFQNGYGRQTYNIPSSCPQCRIKLK